MNKLTRYEPLAIRHRQHRQSTHTHTVTRQQNGFTITTRHYSQQEAEAEQRWQRVAYGVAVEVSERA